MSQTTLRITDDTFPNVRAKLNQILQAIVSKNSGTSAPTEPFPFMWWVDEGSGTIFIRNSTNTQWQTFATFENDNYNFFGAFQRNMVIMWSGPESGIPEGWRICDGQEGTPDLRSRFVNGAGPGGPAVGETGGEERVRLRERQMPSHNHQVIYQVTDPGHDHSYIGKTGSSGEGRSSRDGDPITRNTADAQTGITVDISLTNTGGSQAHENLPSYITQYFIMKL